MIRVAIIGAGIGAQHLDAYRALHDRFDVVALCDLDGARAQAVAAPFGIPVKTDFAAVCADPAVDLIDVCLPPHLHLSACLVAMRAGKDVVCEKPLVASLAEADALLAAVRETGRQVFPVFQYRYGRGTAQLRAVIEAGLAGPLYAGTIETHWNRGADYYAVDWRGTWAGERGGAVLGHAIHIHDILPAFVEPVARDRSGRRGLPPGVDLLDILGGRMQRGFPRQLGLEHHPRVHDLSRRRSLGDRHQ